MMSATSSLSAFQLIGPSDSARYDDDATASPPREDAPAVGQSVLPRCLRRAPSARIVLAVPRDRNPTESGRRARKRARVAQSTRLGGETTIRA